MDQAVFPGYDAARHSANVLAMADQRLTTCADGLERLVVLGHSRLLDDETVARVRALTGDLAAQLAGADHALIAPVHAMLAGNRAVLTHCHALAVEWRLAMTLATRHGLDPVLPPLVQTHANAMMALVASQTRAFEGLRRMCLPLGELPADLQNLAYAMLGAARADQTMVARGDGAPGQHSETRLVLLHRAVAGLGDDIDRALRLDEAGVSLFCTALAIASGHPRETVVLATAEDDPIRLALLLCATGLSQNDVARQLLMLRPDADPALASHTAHEAEALLGATQ